MDNSLKAESEKLTRSWMQHDTAKLRDYLVAGVEDPRLNLQSIFSRHFLARALLGERFEPLMVAEYAFSAVMNWLVKLARTHTDPEEHRAVLHALHRRADNAEGIEIPLYVLQIFAALPVRAGELTVPNYIYDFLSGNQATAPDPLVRPSLDTFRNLWQRALLGHPEAEPGTALRLGPGLSPQPSRPWRVFEPACGSANDYRFLHSYGLARFLDYNGLDLCSKNIENARALFPQISFAEGNIFELAAPDKSFDLAYTHDLFEHLSLHGLETAVRELCRVTSQAMCVGFFNMDEIRDHIVRPVDEYHWNTLSMGRMKELFAQHGFSTRVVHIGTFLRQQLGCNESHNPNAYTLELRRQSLG